MVSPFIWEFFVLIIASVLCWYIRTQEESDLFQGHTLFYCLFHQKWDHNLQNEDRAVWRRFATGCWAHKLIRKQFAEVINQVWSKVILFINLHNQTFFRTIIYKMKIMLHWWRLVTRNWAHNLSRKLFTEGINQVRGSFSHKLTYNQPSFCNQWSQPLLAFTKKKKKKTVQGFLIGFAFQIQKQTMCEITPLWPCCCPKTLSYDWLRATDEAWIPSYKVLLKSKTPREWAKQKWFNLTN